MDQLANSLKRYLKETLDIDVSLRQWLNTDILPIFLQERYVFFEVRILRTSCLVMASRDTADQTPATIHKHINQVRKKWQGEVLYLQQKVTAYNRKRLIQHKIPFVIPLNQMYLPFLGIDLREHFKKITETRESFSPSTQVIVLYYLCRNGNGQFRLTPKKLAGELGYSLMTMTRALDELDGTGLGTIAMEGRERILRFNQDKNQVWEDALNRLRSPVQKSFWVKDISNHPYGLSAGLSALACYSNLAAPENPVMALEGKQWKKICHKDDLMILDAAEPNAGKVEIWRYAPKLFGEKGVVDRLSLFLSMKEDHDERIQFALKDMMGQVEW